MLHIKDIILNKPFALNVFNFFKKIQHNINLRKLSNNYDNASNSTISKEQLLEYNKYRLLGPQEKLRNAPYTSLFINMNGNVNVCGYNKTHILGNIVENKLKDIWLNDKHFELIDSIENYNLSKGCLVCQQKIDDKDYPRAAIYFDSPKAEKNIVLRRVTFELSNLCNLECIMCNGELSSLIRKNVEKKAPLKLPDYDDLLSQIKDFIPDLYFTQYLGGEPLLIKPYYKIWEALVENNKKCKISLQTNATVIPEAFKALLLKSKNQFIISVSIDSFNKENYERIRKKANFATSMQNIEYYLMLMKNKIIDFSINFVPMTVNWKEIIDAVNFANKNKILLSMEEVNSPYEFSFYSLEKNKIVEIINYLELNMPISTTNYYEIKNKELLQNQISQLKHVLNKISLSNSYMSEKCSDSKDAESEFNYYIKNISIKTQVVIDYIDKNILFPLSSLDGADRISYMNKFNRYFYLRNFIHNNKVDDAYNQQQFEGLLINELNSFIKTTF